MEAKLLIPAEGGVHMIADPPDPNGRALATTGLWEWNVSAAIRQNLGPGDVSSSATVGANAGYYAALAARAVGDAGHVYALEPAPQTFRKLERDLDLNHFTNVTPLAVAAGAAEGEATLLRTRRGARPELVASSTTGPTPCAAKCVSSRSMP